MTQKMIDVGVDANDGTGESLRQAFTEVNENFTEIFAAGPVDSDVKIYGNTITTLVTNQNLVLQANGIGSIQSNSTIIPGTPGVYDLGAPTNTFQYAYANYFVGNGRMLTGIGASYSNVEVAKFLADLDTPIKTSGNVQTGNILTIGTIAASGNIVGADIVGSTIRSDGAITAVGNISGGVLIGTAALISGNVAAGYFVGNGSLLTGIKADSASQILNGNSNVNISLADSNIVIGVAGVGNVAVFATTGLAVANDISAQNLTTSGNITSGNIVTSNTIAAQSLQIENIQVSANGNVSLGNVNIKDVATPVANSDAATKFYVDSVVALATEGLAGDSISGNSLQVGNILISSNGTVSLGNVSIKNVAAPVANSDAATKLYVDSALAAATNSITTVTKSIANVTQNLIGNAIALGEPPDSSLTVNAAYNGWTAETNVTSAIDDLNQVVLNIANGTYVSQASFTATPLAGPSPLRVSFTGSYSGSVDKHHWDFGDGTTSTDANPSHVYSNVSGGQYSVSYTAYNSRGTYGGSIAAGAKGSVVTSSRTNYITLYTPTPIAAFSLVDADVDSGTAVAVNNNSQYASSFELDWGDGSNVTIDSAWDSQSHTYPDVTATDSRYEIELTATSSTAGPTEVVSTATPRYVKVYSTHAPVVTSNTVTVINRQASNGGVVSFTNQTPGTPGSSALFGTQQRYRFNWGDGSDNYVNVQTGTAGNPGAANLTHAYALTSAQQAAGTTVSYTANLWLETGHSQSPFKSSNVTITVEPEVRADFVGQAVNASDAGSPQIGYIHTDYNGNNRASFVFQNTSQHGNVFDWDFGDSNSINDVANTSNVNHTYSNVGNYTVTLTAQGTPGTTAQTNTRTRTNYITIAPVPVAPGPLSSKTISLTRSSEGSSPLLAAAATDNTGGTAPAAGTAVVRYVTPADIPTSTATGANTSLSGTLAAYVNNTESGNVSFSLGANAVGTYDQLSVVADADAHDVISAVTYPTGFYKVFSASINAPLVTLPTGWNNYRLEHTASGNTNSVGFVKDNLLAVPVLNSSVVTVTETTPGTYRYISGVPYYNTGSPVLSVNNLAVANLTGQTYRSTTSPLTIAAGATYENTSGSVVVAQTKTYAQLDGASSMLSAGVPRANVGIGSDYVMGNISVNVNGSARAVGTIRANVINVNGSSSTTQLPVKIQVYNLPLTGFNENNIPVAAGLGSAHTDNGVRVYGLGSGNTPALASGVNYYTNRAWTGAVAVAGTSEAIVRWGVLQHFDSVDFSKGYMPLGPDLITGRSGLQYFTFAFRRATVANFDIVLSAPSGVAGVWIAAPGTTIDSNIAVPGTPGYPGPTSTINGWLEGHKQYNGSGVPGNSATGGNQTGTNGCALTGADIVPLNTAIVSQRYTMTLGSQNSSNSIGNTVLVRIALAAGQTVTDLQIGTAS